MDGYTFAPGQNVFTPAQLDTVAQKLLQAYPCPNYAAAGQPNFGVKNGGWRPATATPTTDPRLLDRPATTTRWILNADVGPDQLGRQARLGHQQPRPGHFPHRLPAHHQHQHCATGPDPRRNRQLWRPHPDLPERKLHAQRDAHLLAHADQRVHASGSTTAPMPTCSTTTTQHRGDPRIERRAGQRRPFRTGGLPST